MSEQTELVTACVARVSMQKDGSMSILVLEEPIDSVHTPIYRDCKASSSSVDLAVQCVTELRKHSQSRSM